MILEVESPVHIHWFIFSCFLSNLFEVVYHRLYFSERLYLFKFCFLRDIEETAVGVNWSWGHLEVDETLESSLFFHQRDDAMAWWAPQSKLVPLLQRANMINFYFVSLDPFNVFKVHRLLIYPDDKRVGTIINYPFHVLDGPYRMTVAEVKSVFDCFPGRIQLRKHYLLISCN